MRKIYLMVAVSGFLSICSLVGLSFARQTRKAIAVVDIVELFNGFKMKTELEARAERGLHGVQSHVDSITTLMQYAERQNDGPTLEAIRNQLSEAKNIAALAYETSNSAINEAVWNRLNPILHQYGRSHKYEIIIGANGMGTVLYNAEAVDITNDVMKYASSMYEGN